MIGPGLLQRFIAAFIFLALPPAPILVAAENSKDKIEPALPRILQVRPLAVIAGATNALNLRGQNLTNLSALQFTNHWDGSFIDVRSSGPAEVPKEYEARKIGDYQLKLSVFIPAQFAGETNALVAETPGGLSSPFPLLILDKGAVLDEQEPNGGLEQATLIEGNHFIRGVIKEPGDVDVFRFSARTGERIVAEIYAAPGGSTLDSLVTIYDTAGHVLAVNDDVAGQRDSRVEWKASGAGPVAVCVQDANDKGGAAHLYLLRVTVIR